MAWRFASTLALKRNFQFRTSSFALQDRSSKFEVRSSMALALAWPTDAELLHLPLEVRALDSEPRRGAVWPAKDPVSSLKNSE